MRNFLTILWGLWFSLWYNALGHFAIGCMSVNEGFFLACCMKIINICRHSHTLCYNSFSTGEHSKYELVSTCSFLPIELYANLDQHNFSKPIFFNLLCFSHRQKSFTSHDPLFIWILHGTVLSTSANSFSCIPPFLTFWLVFLDSCTPLSSMRVSFSLF